jgi:hypothetical protein
MDNKLKCYEVALAFDHTLAPDEKRALPCRVLRQNRGLGVVAPNLEEALRLARELVEGEGKENVEIHQARLLHVVDVVCPIWTEQMIQQVRADAAAMGEELGWDLERAAS